MMRLVNFFGDHTGLLGDKTLAHLGISGLAMAIALILALPLGVLLGHRHRGSFVAINVSNVFRALPSLALIAISLALLGLSLLNILIALVALAIPPILTNTYVGVRQVDRETVDAARGVGLSEAQIIAKVELPLALNTIFSGLRLAAVAVVATATIAPLGNVDSLGVPIITPQTYGEPGQLGAAILVALITLATDAGLGLVQRVVTPAGLKIDAPARTKRFSLPIPWRTETE